MGVPDGEHQVVALQRLAERLDALADAAELMGDDGGASRFRTAAWRCRMRAMDDLDG